MSAINALREKHALADLLSAASMARSTFYYHSRQQAQPCKDSELKSKIRTIYHQHKGRYGYRRITYALRNLGWLVNHKRVQRLMQTMGLKSLVRPKKYRSYRGQEGRIATNALQREFTASKPNKKWVTDVTEFNVKGEKLYLSPLIDLYNGEVVAYKIKRRPVLRLVTDMLKEALKHLNGHEKPMLHSDQGWQYQNPQYQRILQENQLVQSMSRKGNCLDNASAESFFGTLKSELYHLQKWQSVEQLEKAIDEYIYYYNHERIRLKLKGLSPVQYRTQAIAA